MGKKKTVDIVWVQSVTTLVLFVILPFLVERNWMEWMREPVLYLVAFVMLLIVTVLGNLAIRKLGYYQYILSMVMVFLLYRNLPIYITNVFERFRPEFQLPPLVPISELKALPVLIIPFLIATITTLVHSVVVLAIDKRRIKQEKLIAELALLKTQVNPHFFFNSLNSIYHLALTKDDKAPDAIISLSDMMRYVLTDARAEFVPVEKEIDYLNRYIALQRQRVPEQTRVNYSVAVDDESIRIAPLLLITFVENAFKYGVSGSFETEIKIDLTIRDGVLSFVVRNECHANTSHVYGTASGIDNVKKRLEGIYGKNHKLYIYANADEYLVELRIDLGKHLS